MRIIFGAGFSLPPFSPGMTWHWLQYVVGLTRLGHDVVFVEEVEPEWVVNRRNDRCRLEDSVNVRTFENVLRRFGLFERACLACRDGSTFGMSHEALAAAARGADLLISMSGNIKLPAILDGVKRRVYVDQDPVYTQLWRAEYGADMNFAPFDVFVSVGLNIGTPRTDIPDAGVSWIHVLPPVLLDWWPFAVDSGCERFRTVASLRAFADVKHQGITYGSKFDQLRAIADLPARVDQQLEIAVKNYDDHVTALKPLVDKGWILTSAHLIDDLDKYRDYIVASRAEIGIAQGAYVQGRSGWFSDRWSHFLACGKPVVAQSTGFEHRVPTGAGLVTFNNLDEVAAGIDAINADYERHCHAAHELAVEYLDHRKVLPTLLEACTVSQPVRMAEAE